MNYLDEEQLREDLIEIILDNCKHKETVTEDRTQYCVHCESYGSIFYDDEDEPFVEDWEHRKDLLNDVPTDELIERTKEVSNE